MSAALAYMNWGRWVADCPADGCASAVAVAAGQTGIVCSNNHISPLTWPTPATVVAIGVALDKRPDPRNRNWFPAGHPFATAAGYPMDQTPAELDAETEQGLQAAAEAAAGRDQLRTILADLGITVGPDGTFTGKILEES
jgi:hypothetical protein